MDNSLTNQASFLRKGKTSEGSTNASRLAAIAGRIDYRLVLLGSMLPDIIDKPIGQYFLRDTFSNGRIFGHTLFFCLIIFLIGLYRYRRCGGTGGIVLSLCSGSHLVLDQIWHSPKTLFWPILGLAFDKLDLSDWMPSMWGALWNDPSVYGPEIVGLLILALFGLKLLRSRRVLDFLKRGTTGWTATTF